MQFDPKYKGVFDNKSCIINSAWVERTDIDRFLRCVQFWNTLALGEAIIELFDRDIFFRLAATDEGVVERTRITLLHADKILLHVQRTLKGASHAARRYMQTHAGY